MRQNLLSILMLAAVALSSSNIILDSSQARFHRSQINDNIFMNDNSNMIDKLFCDNNNLKADEKTLNLCRILKMKYNVNADNNRIKFDNFDVESGFNDKSKGFRKEQWHNYPRQLDRLQKFLYDKSAYTDREGIPEVYSPISENVVDENTIPMLNNENFYEIEPKKNIDKTNNIYDSVLTSTNPLLILKIRLAYLDKSLTNNDIEDTEQYSNIPNTDTDITNRIISRENNIIDSHSPLNPSDNNFEDDNQLNPSLLTSSTLYNQNSNDDTVTRLKSVPTKKRIFSMWSRLQSLNPKSHELHHRRHLHAYYGFPGSDGSGSIVSAETRALVRPPGSPLRWG